MYKYRSYSSSYRRISFNIFLAPAAECIHTFRDPQAQQEYPDISPTCEFEEGLIAVPKLAQIELRDNGHLNAIASCNRC